jgi:EpsI family protein
MSTNTKTQLSLTVIMLLSFLICIPMQPSKFYKDDHQFSSLKEIVPSRFDDWEEIDLSNTGGIVDPTSSSLVNQIYNQTLSRTYVNKVTQQTIMLSIAYGEDQSDSRELHIPDACYPAQGFLLSEKSDVVLDTARGQIKARKLLATQSSRVEPLIYWITMSDNQVRKGYDSKLTQLKLGLRGYIPDGFVVRVSTINESVNDAYQLEEQFINSLLQSLKPDALVRLTGLNPDVSGGK